MNPGKFILIDGVFHPCDEAIFTYEELGSLIFSEKIRSIRNSFPFFREFIELIKLKGIILNCELPDEFEGNGSGLLRQMERILVKNKHFMSAVLSIHLYSLHGKPSYSISSAGYSDTSYKLNKSGVFLHLFDKIQKPVSSLSNISLGSELFWTIADSHLSGSKADQFVLKNTEGAVVEIPGSSLFVLKDEVVYYPDIASGAYVDLICPTLHLIFDSMGINHSAKQNLSVDDLYDANELFVANSVNGIQWVVGFEEKRYYCKIVKKINEELNLKVLV